MRGAATALFLSCAAPAAAQDISLITPIDCDLTQTCYIQQYMDRDPGPEVQDYTCAALANNDHSGTDFALPSMQMMRAGVDVLAAAPGIVQGIRDGMADTGRTAENAETLKGRECGNGVRVEHADGWSTQYCHLRQGSIAVTTGQQVAAGQALGKVGKSGSATFPHVHFSLRKDGQRLDPFRPTADGDTCTATTDTSLWMDTPAYRAGGLISIGMFDRIPTYDEVKEGSPHLSELHKDLPALTIWSYSFGTRKDDVLRLSLKGPDGTLVAEDIRLPKPQALAMRAIGKRRSAAPWPAGHYTGTVTLLRDGRMLERRDITLTLR